VCNGARTLQACLDAVSRSDAVSRTTGASCEYIVVNDGSTDDSAQIARRAGARVIDEVTRGGPARARNIGALAASGEILLFIDADVCVHEGTIARAVRALADDSSLDAVIGSYDFEPAEPNFLSQYKNLFHSFVHHHGCRDASTFWTGCGAIRREFFLQSGGFPEQWKRPSVEDIAFGAVIRRLGGRIRLDPELQVKHLKHWGLAGLLRTDIFDRAIPWTVLMLRNRAMPNDLNLRIEQRFCVALVCTAAVLAVRFPALSGLAILLAILLNLGLYRFFASKRGWPFAIRTVPIHQLYFLYSGLAMVTGVALFALKTEPQLTTKPAVKTEPLAIPPEIGV
jgi:Glycosyl transferase family 2